VTCCSELDTLFKKQGVFIPRTDEWARNSRGYIKKRTYRKLSKRK
jgi:hypothetical protein